MPNRFFYQLNLEQYSPNPRPVLPGDITIRSIQHEDSEKLAHLMLAAYSGTIDDDGGVLEDARAEVENYVRGEYGSPLLAASRIALDNTQQALAAALLTRWGEPEAPLVAFVMTNPSQQGKGLALGLLHESLTELKSTNESTVRAVITDGNLASERLFASLGFKKEPISAAHTAC